MNIPVSQFSGTALNLARGGGSQFLERMLVLATDHLGADGAVLVSHRENKCDILCSVGLPMSTDADVNDEECAAFARLAGQLLEDARRDETTRTWTFVRAAPYWQSLLLLKLDVRLPGVVVMAIFGSHRPAAPRAMREPTAAFGKQIEVLLDLFSLIGEIADLSNRPLVFGSEENRVHEAVASFKHQHEETSHNVVERFLMDTLVQQPRVLSRGNVSYHALRRWRATVKTEQISALKAIKKSPSDNFAAVIAEEMSSWSRRAFGGLAFTSIVAVPCGHSGAHCLAERIAKQVATLLGIPFVDAFEQLAVSGSSHPKSNVGRPKMKLQTVPVGFVLLVDDVATSGAHIEEATTALRSHDLAVTSIAWISAG